MGSFLEALCIDTHSHGLRCRAPSCETTFLVEDGSSLDALWAAAAKREAHELASHGLRFHVKQLASPYGSKGHRPYQQAKARA